MKKKNLHSVILSAGIFFTFQNVLHAQCDCNQPDPFGYCYSANSTNGQIGSSCGLLSFSINGATSASKCGSPVCSTTSLYFDYTVYMPSNTVTGFYYKVTGGVVSRETITRGNSQPQVIRENCSTEAQYGSVNYVNALTLRINWTTSSPSNCIVIWGYTGVSAQGPTMLSYFEKLSVATANATSAPAAPTGISLSSPSTYPICGWKVASSFVSNAETYTWTGAGNATYHYITGPSISENQTSYLCVRANNACASSANYCTYITAPNNPSCGFVPRNNIANGNDIISNNKPAEFIVAPNPVGSQLNIYGITDETDAVIVLSTSGKTVYTANAKNQPQMRIDVSKLPRGMYMVILRQRDGTVINKKVMLQ